MGRNVIQAEEDELGRYDCLTDDGADRKLPEKCRNCENSFWLGDRMYFSSPHLNIKAYWCRTCIKNQTVADNL